MGRSLVAITACGWLAMGASCNSSSGTGSGKGSGGSGSPSSSGGSGSPSGSGGSGSPSGSGGSGSPSGSGGSGGAIAGTGGAATGGNGDSGGRGVAGDGGGAGMGGAVVACQPAVPVATGTAATVAVNLDMAGATVGNDLMGIHTSVYDGAMQNATTPPLLKAASVTSLRYPGGSYADLYHWETHAGTMTPTSGAGNNTVYVAPNADFGHFVSFLESTGAHAFITINYGTNPAGTGPGVPQEAAAWVAYANSSPSSTTAIGMDSTGKDWKTAGYWASLRAAAPLDADDGLNFLRISHPDPVGIKYWEIGNEIYGNGYYYGGNGWEPDMHVAYPATGTATNRQNNAMLSPNTYGMGVKAFATAMKAIDATVQIGGIVHWPFTEYADWNAAVLKQACPSMDFAVNHWYAGTTLATLMAVPKADIPKMFMELRQQLTMTANMCGTKGATMPIAITEWGPNTNAGNVVIMPPAGTQIVGIFAAESYAHFMEQGALAVHWLELHNDSYLAGPTMDSPTILPDTPRWGYHGAQMASYLAGAGDTMVQATVSNAGALMTSLQAHASRHADGSVSVMLTNTSPTVAANVTVNVSGASTMLACVGTRYAYTPVSTDQDGMVISEPIFSATSRTSASVAVPAYSVVVVRFPKG